VTDVVVDAEDIIRDWAAAWLAARPGGGRVSTEAPANLNDVLPYIQVARIGGRERDYVLDTASVAFDVFAASRPAARALAVALRNAVLLELAGSVTGGAFITKTRTLSAPAWRPWNNTTVRRFGAVYDITLKPANN
jgi:hypothetical protein